MMITVQIITVSVEAIKKMISNVGNHILKSSTTYYENDSFYLRPEGTGHLIMN